MRSGLSGGICRKQVCPLETQDHGGALGSPLDIVRHPVTFVVLQRFRIRPYSLPVRTRETEGRPFRDNPPSNFPKRISSPLYSQISLTRKDPPFFRIRSFSSLISFWLNPIIFSLSLPVLWISKRLPRKSSPVPALGIRRTHSGKCVYILCRVICRLDRPPLRL